MSRELRWATSSYSRCDVAKPFNARHSMPAAESSRWVSRAEASMAEAVSLVAGRRVVGALCLGRSLLLWFLLRRRGMDAALIVGSKSHVDETWMAHAWVELDGHPVNDVADVRDHYASFGLDLPRLRPSSAGTAGRRG